MNFSAKFNKLLAITIISNFFLFTNAKAQISIIRDAQTESLLWEICHPIFIKAGLNTKNLKIYIVNDSSINAFVSGGQNIFINTGLITKFSNPEVIFGVIAHEVGHIAAAHLATSSENLSEIVKMSMIGYLAGIGAIIASNSDAASALIMSSEHITNRLAMKYSRSQEESADILALQYLAKLQVSSEGLLEIMQYFKQQNIGIEKIIDPYDLTHPASSSRIDLIKNNQSKYFGENYQKNSFKLVKLSKKLRHVQAKLNGFIGNIDQVLNQYKNDHDESADLARAIIYYRSNKLHEAFKIIDRLINKNPNDGFLFELKAELLYYDNKIIEAIVYYQKAIKLLGNNFSTLSKINIASAIINLQTLDDDLLNLAQKNLIEAKNIESDNPQIYKILAKIYQQKNIQGKSLLAMAEFNYWQNNLEKSAKYAKEALSNLEKCQKDNQINAKDHCDESSILRAKDLVMLTENSKR